MRRAFFGYEYSNSRRPYPVIYFDEVPSNRRERDMVVEIDPTFSLDSLIVMYPHPKLLNIESKHAKKREKEWKMTRPVQGFLDSHGTFFDTEAEAEFSDASYHLFLRATDAVEELKKDYDPETSPPLQDMLIEYLMMFIRDSETLIYDYITTKRKLVQASGPLNSSGAAAEAPPETVGVAGRPTEGDQVVGEPVPVEPSLPVGERTNAEAEPPPVRNKSKNKTKSEPDISDY